MGALRRPKSRDATAGIACVPFASRRRAYKTNFRDDPESLPCVAWIVWGCPRSPWRIDATSTGRKLPTIRRMGRADQRQRSDIGDERQRPAPQHARRDRFRLRSRAMSETFLLVDGENIDATLGGSLLGRRPAPEERPRWDRVRDYARAVWDQPVRGLFFLNATARADAVRPGADARSGYRPVLLSGPRGGQGRRRRDPAHARGAGRARHGDVLLASHDGDFAPQVAALLRRDGRRVGVIGFREMTSGALTELAATGSSSTTSRTTSARSQWRCRASALSRSSSSIPGRCSAEARNSRQSAARNTHAVPPSALGIGGCAAVRDWIRAVSPQPVNVAAVRTSSLID